MTTLPAVVRIVDLPAATTITGGEVFEVIQTSGGVGLSVQVPLTAVVTSTLGALPTGGGTSQILAKSSGTNFAAAWFDVTSFISVNTAAGLATSGTGTALVMRVATAGISSTMLGAAAVQRSNITAFAIGSAQIDTSGIVRANLTSFLIGSTQIDTAAIGTAQVVTGAIGMTLLNTLTPNAVASANDTTSFSANYRMYMITFDQIVPATNTSYLRMQIATVGNTWVAAGYLAAINVPGVGLETDATSFLISGKTATTSVSSNANHGVWGSIYFCNAVGSSGARGISGSASYLAANGSVQAATVGGSSGQISLATGINFLFNSGNIATGTIKIYGMY